MTVRDNNDIKLSTKNFEENRPEVWKTFCKSFFCGHKDSEKRNRRCDMIFQIFYNMLHNGKRKAPLPTLIAQSIHDVCKSKRPMKALNRLFLCSSYDDVGRIDIGFAKHLITLAGDNRVPVAPAIVPNVTIHAVTDNWDHREHTYGKNTR